MRCIQLDDANSCKIFGQAGRPAVRASLRPELEMCGLDRGPAMLFLTTLERLTA